MSRRVPTTWLHFYVILELIWGCSWGTDSLGGMVEIRNVLDLGRGGYTQVHVFVKKWLNFTLKIYVFHSMQKISVKKLKEFNFQKQ